MEELTAVDDIDSVVTKNPNSVVLVYKEGCPWCQKLKGELEALEKDGKAKVYLISADVAGGVVSRLGAKGVPVTLTFKECEVNHVYEGYSPNILPTLEKEYEDAQPVCRVDLSKILFEKTKIGEPIL